MSPRLRGSWKASFCFCACIGTMNGALTRPSGTLSPSEGERDGVRGQVHGERRVWGAAATKSGVIRRSAVPDDLLIHIRNPNNILVVGAALVGSEIPVFGVAEASGVAIEECKLGAFVVPV